ncbi:alpha/beta hydrolase [Streptomyces sp. NPDC101227]|uniref:alpha/beta hydrolase n=1 Tax=Streptomyces sp. NPDC101227 TaxID=3366136 RepID=UPI003822D2F7
MHPPHPSHAPQAPHPSASSHRARRPRRRRPLLIGAAIMAVCLAAVLPVLVHLDAFSDEGEPLSFDAPDRPAPASAPADPTVRMPTGPRSEFRTANTLDDGTKIGVTTLHGKKSGFTGKVWVWAPKEYYEDRYRNSAFPVLIALPGGPGYPVNYWMGTDLKLQSTVSDMVTAGRSKPFLVVMPVLNPDADHYYDGSDIPGQPKMGTWMSDDVPDLVKANFRTYADRNGWAFMGSSSGGFAGLKQVLQHPDRFAAVIASGPDTRPDSPLWRGHEKEMRANDPGLLAERLAARPDAPPVHIEFQIGTEEGGRAALERFVRKYGDGTGPVTARLHVIQGGGHDAKSYIRGMREATLEGISKVLRGPAPAAGG